MKVCFRADASTGIGSGHVMRCLTLADALAAAGAEAFFVCREDEGNLIGFIEGKGHPVHRLPETPAAGIQWSSDSQLTAAAIKREGGADWLVVDSYALERKWEQALRSRVGRLMVIDDLANREHDCDLLLDQNFYRDLAGRYRGLVPEGCTKLLGPGYALLRKDFREARRSLRERDGTVSRVMVFFGAGDPSNETGKAIEALELSGRDDLHLDVVVGAANPHAESIARACRERGGACCHRQVANMAKMMAAADLFIGAGGSTTWERCFLGLPSVVLALADNQLQLSRDTAAYGALLFMGRSDEVSAEQLAAGLRRLLAEPESLKTMGSRALALMQPLADSPRHPAVSIIMGEGHVATS